MEATINQSAETVRKFTSRIASIDVFRALTMFLMIFVNDLWSVKGVPHWMGHAEFNEDMLGLSDVVFPAFLFILGMSILLAIEGRLAKNESKLSIVFHIIVRSFALLVMGLFSVNSGSGISPEVGIPRHIFSLIMVICFFIIWNKYRPTTNKNVKFFRLSFQILAGITLLVLAIIYRDPSNGYFQTRWWGILGLIGWTYLICALIYLFFRKNWTILILWGIIFTLLCMANSNKWLGEFAGILPGNGCFHAFTMAGLLLSLVFNRPKSEISMQRKLLFSFVAGVLFLLLGWISNKFWIISKLQETPSWLFYCTGISIISYLAIYWLCDVKNKANLFNIIKPAGTSTLTCYLIPTIVYSLFVIVGFKGIGFMSEGGIGLLKCVLFSLLIIGITALLEKVNIKLKI